MTDNTNPSSETNNSTPVARPRRNSMFVGAFLALIGVTCYSLFGLFGLVASSAPYIAGVAMFFALLGVLATLVVTLKKLRRSSNSALATWDSFAAIATIGVVGYFLAACVQTFEPAGDAATYWTAGAIAAGTFGALFLCGKYVGELFKAGKNSK